MSKKLMEQTGKRGNKHSHGVITISQAFHNKNTKNGNNDQSKFVQQSHGSCCGASNLLL